MAQDDIVLVDSTTKISSFLDGLPDLQVEPPALYIDIEGVYLGRLGSVSIISVYVLPLKRTYLIDTHVLGQAAVDTASSGGVSLKSILESPLIPKVFFDIRNDSDALYSHFGVSVDGIRDLQLMELALRTRPKTFLSGLAKCIQLESPLSSWEKLQWKISKDEGHRLFDPNQGGRYEVFNERPLKPEIQRYCAQDVSILPGLYTVYNTRLQASNQAVWRVKIQQATRDRIVLSQSPDYNGKGQHMARGPW